MLHVISPTGDNQHASSMIDLFTSNDILVARELMPNQMSIFTCLCTILIGSGHTIHLSDKHIIQAGIIYIVIPAWHYHIPCFKNTTANQVESTTYKEMYHNCIRKTLCHIISDWPPHWSQTPIKWVSPSSSWISLFEKATITYEFIPVSKLSWELIWLCLLSSFPQLVYTDVCICISKHTWFSCNPLQAVMA